MNPFNPGTYLVLQYKIHILRRTSYYSVNDCVQPMLIASPVNGQEWINTNNQHLDLILPPEARNKIVLRVLNMAEYQGEAKLRRRISVVYFNFIEHSTKHTRKLTTAFLLLLLSIIICSLIFHYKTGDIVMVESVRGIHLIQIADVMVDVQKMKMAATRLRNKIGIAGHGILFGGTLLLPLAQNMACLQRQCQQQQCYYY
jgi:hypothetical protein